MYNVKYIKVQKHESAENILYHYLWLFDIVNTEPKNRNISNVPKSDSSGEIHPTVSWYTEQF